MTNTATRLKQIMDERGLKQADILRRAQPYCEKYKIKLGKSDLSQFVNGKNTPGQWKLTILSLALDVSEGWLMGLDVPKEREEPDDQEDTGLSEIISIFTKLSSENRSKLLELSRLYLSAQHNNGETP